MTRIPVVPASIATTTVGADMLGARILAGANLGSDARLGGTDTAADTFASGPDAPYVKLPIDLGIEVEPFGLITRAGSSLPRVATMMIDMVIRKPAP